MQILINTHLMETPALTKADPSYILLISLLFNDSIRARDKADGNIFKAVAAAATCRQILDSRRSRPCLAAHKMPLESSKKIDADIKRSSLDGFARVKTIGPGRVRMGK